ncbi:MAG: hypothetical protein ACYTHJ_20775 [Planctomycetota bacterium]|jgi:hypothetical protein
MFTVNRNPTSQDLAKFGRAMIIGFSLLGAVAWFLPWLLSDNPLGWSASRNQVTAIVFVGLGAALWLLSIAATGPTRAIYIVWMSVAVPIGIGMGTIMLTLFFFLLLPIFSLIVRMGDPLRKKLTDDDSYWEEHKPYEATLERMSRLF